MHLPSSLTLPHWRSLLRHALPNIIEGKIIPTAVFLVTLQLAGTGWALVSALTWSLAALGLRVGRRRTVNGILVLTTLALAARTVAALATGSVVVYFLQPTIATGLIGLAFLASVPLRRPLVERLASDLVPMDDETRSHPVIRRFFRHVSLWWGCTSMVNFGITLWLLLTASPTTFVVVKSFLGPLTTTMTLAVAFVWLRSMLARSGTTVVFAAQSA